MGLRFRGHLRLLHESILCFVSCGFRLQSGWCTSQVQNLRFRAHFYNPCGRDFRTTDRVLPRTFRVEYPPPPCRLGPLGYPPCPAFPFFGGGQFLGFPPPLQVNLPVLPPFFLNSLFFPPPPPLQVTLPVLVFFWNSLVFFVLCEEFLFFRAFFPPFPGISRVRQG